MRTIIIIVMQKYTCAILTHPTSAWPGIQTIIASYKASACYIMEYNY